MAGSHEVAVSVVIGSYNRRPYLRPLFRSLRRELVGLPHEIIVVDGGSTDGSAEWLMKQKDVITIVQHNRGRWRGEPIKRRSWSYFMNLGFKCTQGKFVCMLSDDCLVIPGAIKHGVEDFEELLVQGQKVGALAFFFRDWPEETRYRVAYALWGTRLRLNHGLYLRDALEQVGWCDEDHYEFYFADGDLSLRLWEAGFELLPAPRSFVEHFSEATFKVKLSNSEVLEADIAAYESRWGAGSADSCTMEWSSFVDDTRTVEEFPLSGRLQLHTLRIARRLGLAKPNPLE